MIAQLKFVSSLNLVKNLFRTVKEKMKEKIIYYEKSLIPERRDPSNTSPIKPPPYILSPEKLKELEAYRVKTEAEIVTCKVCSSSVKYLEWIRSGLENCKICGFTLAPAYYDPEWVEDDSGIYLVEEGCKGTYWESDYVLAKISNDNKVKIRNVTVEQTKEHEYRPPSELSEFELKNLWVDIPDSYQDMQSNKELCAKLLLKLGWLPGEVYEKEE